LYNKIGLPRKWFHALQLYFTSQKLYNWRTTVISNFSPGSNPQEKSFDFPHDQIRLSISWNGIYFFNVSRWDCLLQHSSHFLLCEVIYSSRVFLIFPKRKRKQESSYSALFWVLSGPYLKRKKNVYFTKLFCIFASPLPSQNYSLIYAASWRNVVEGFCTCSNNLKWIISTQNPLLHSFLPIKSLTKYFNYYFNTEIWQHTFLKVTGFKNR